MAGSIQLSKLAGLFLVAKWKPAAAVALWPQLLALTEPSAQLSLFSLSVTHEECSLVVSADAKLPDAGPEFPAAIEPGYAAFVVHGPLDFALVGILAALTSALARASISVFAVSTYDTDYILVKDEKSVEAVKAWEAYNGDIQIKVIIP